MKIEVSEDGYILLREVFNGIMLMTEEGHSLGICMRDDTFEINVMPKGDNENCWQRVNWLTKNISRMSKEIKADENQRTANDPC